MRLCLLLLAAWPLLAQNALYLDLSGPWRFQATDDPRYAQPGLDDSQWRTLTLPIADTPIPGVTRIYGLRRRVELPTGTDRTRLALTLGAIWNGYEIYLDGKLVDSTGNLDSPERAHLPQPRTFALPPVSSNSMQLAIRVYRSIALPPQWRFPDNGPYLFTHLSGATTGGSRACTVPAAVRGPITRPRLRYDPAFDRLPQLLRLDHRSQPPRATLVCPRRSNPGKRRVL